MELIFLWILFVLVAIAAGCISTAFVNGPAAARWGVGALTALATYAVLHLLVPGAGQWLLGQ